MNAKEHLSEDKELKELLSKHLLRGKVERIMESYHQAKLKEGEGERERLMCVDKKHYSWITEGKTYKIFENPNGFNYPHKRFIHITNDLGFIKAYYRSCFEAL